MQLVVEHKAPDLNALSPRCVRRCLRVSERGVRRPNRKSLLSVWHTLTPAIEALQKQHLLRSHVLLVVELMLLIWRDSHGLSLHLVAVRGRVVVRVRQNFLATVIEIQRVSALGVHEIRWDKVFWRSAPPVYNCKGSVGCRILNWPPYVDDLVATLYELICLLCWQVTTYTCFCSARCLINLVDG